MPRRPPRTPPKMAGLLDLDLDEVDDAEGEEEGLLLVWVRKMASMLLPQPASGDFTVAPPWELPPMMVEICRGTMYAVLG